MRSVLLLARRVHYRRNMTSELSVTHEITPAAAPSARSTGARTAFLDHIRILLTVLVILHHAAITYGAPGGWYVNGLEPDHLGGNLWRASMLFVSVNQSFFMGFFFLIAGYFTASSFLRKGVLKYGKDRLVRLGVPLLIGAGFFSPLAISLAQVYRGGGLIDGFYWVYAMGHYECGPLWFIQALLIFSAIYALVMLFVGRGDRSVRERAFPSHLAILAGALFTGGLAFLLRQRFPVGENFWSMQLGYFSSYVVLFYVGCMASKHRWLEKVELRHALPWMIVSLAAISLMFFPMPEGDSSRGWNAAALFYAMWEPFVAIGIIMGMLYIGRRFFSGTNRFWTHLARCSFAVFCIHAPVLVGMTLLAKNWAVGPLEKWAIVGGASCVACWAIASILVRLPGLRRVF